MGKNIIIHDVGLRDGLQMEEGIVPTEKKLQWFKMLLLSGVDIIQAGSFVHPKRVPQMADSDELFGLVRKEMAGLKTTLSGLVLNEKGLERALTCDTDMICMGVSASESHSQKNTGMGTAEALKRITQMGKNALNAGRKVQVSVQSAFGCGFEGRVPQDKVLEIIASYLNAGFTQISLADTAGHATPKAVAEMFEAAQKLSSSVEWTCHFHNTYGLALANCYAALNAGVSAFEASFAGLGGCPFTAIAGGNTCTEDMLHMFQRMGLRADINLDTLIHLARDAAAFFNREMNGTVYKTGPIKD